MGQTMSKISLELHERSVRLVPDNERQRASRRQAALSITAKTGLRRSR